MTSKNKRANQYKEVFALPRSDGPGVALSPFRSCLCAKPSAKFGSARKSRCGALCCADFRGPWTEARGEAFARFSGAVDRGRQG